ncbi:hypothetical protein EJ03DRAFT_384312 [Teratosphaeria nubilosa]|uniref:Uncharacterized protein n=1 Tax=Teratosphaeria nubilosa TaxID=161662 RepID=A0A6G1L252_9PEZI|nr:hypothetical protein EJ03DRAFT_384312 [Teratosphaeria nubilosa]
MQSSHVIEVERLDERRVARLPALRSLSKMMRCLKRGKSSGSDGPGSSPTQNEAKVIKEPLLNELEKHNNAGFTISRREQIIDRETNKPAGVASADAPRHSHMRERSAEPSIIAIDDTQNGIAGGQAEIADSQKPRTRHRSLLKTEKETSKFDAVQGIIRYNPEFEHVERQEDGWLVRTLTPI